MGSAQKGTKSGRKSLGPRRALGDISNSTGSRGTSTPGAGKGKSKAGKSAKKAIRSVSKSVVATPRAAVKPTFQEEDDIEFVFGGTGAPSLGQASPIEPLLDFDIKPLLESVATSGITSQALHSALNAVSGPPKPMPIEMEPPRRRKTVKEIFDSDPGAILSDDTPAGMPVFTDEDIAELEPTLDDLMCAEFDIHIGVADDAGADAGGAGALTQAAGGVRSGIAFNLGVDAPPPPPATPASAGASHSGDDVRPSGPARR